MSDEQHKGPDIGSMMFAMKGSSSNPGSGSNMGHSEGGGMAHHGGGASHHGGINEIFYHGGEDRDLWKHLYESGAQSHYDGPFKSYIGSPDKAFRGMLDLKMTNFINLKIASPAAHLNIKNPNILSPSKATGGQGGGGH